MTTLAWHFLPANGCLRYNDGRSPKPGEWLEAEGPLSLRRNGMHASKLLIDALRYAPGPLVCRVELEGELIEGDDKLVARRRKILWMYDAADVLYEFACREAEDALEAVPSKPDPRSLRAIEARRQFQRGEISKAELQQAADAAYASADAAYAYAAADADADAAYAYAYAAADADAYAAYAAAYAAYAAAADAAAYAAYAAAYAATRQSQNRRLAAMISRNRP